MPECNGHFGENHLIHAEKKSLAYGLGDRHLPAVILLRSRQPFYFQPHAFILPALHISKFNFSELLMQTSVDSDRATVGHCSCPVMLVINWA